AGEVGLRLTAPAPMLDKSRRCLIFRRTRPQRGARHLRVRKENSGNRVNEYALYMRSVRVAWVDFHGLRCHPWPCMLLKRRFFADSIPSALTKPTVYAGFHVSKSRFGAQIREQVIRLPDVFPSVSIFSRTATLPDA